MEFNHRLGVVGFDNRQSPDVERAEWENDMLDNIELSPDNRPIVLAVDDHQVHMDVLAARMKEPSFMEASQAVMDAYMDHYQEHMDAQAQQQQVQAMEAAASGQPAQPQPSGADPQQVSPHGKGAPSSVREGIAKADMAPGSIQ